MSGAWGDPVAWPRNVSGDRYIFHVRGWWPYSSLNLNCGTFNLEPSTAGIVPSGESTICSDLGPETGPNGFAKQSSDTYGTTGGNKGAYGANLYYNYSLLNTPGDGNTYASDVILNCRGTGQAWYGAAQVQSPIGYGARGVLPISSTGLVQYALLSSNATGTSMPVQVVTGGSKPLTVAIANACGSCLPVNLRLTGNITFYSNQGTGN